MILNRVSTFYQTYIPIDNKGKNNIAKPQAIKSQEFKAKLV